jgi:hypothetical protein
VCRKTDTIQQIENDHEIAAIDVVARYGLLRQKGTPIAMPIANPKASFCAWHRWLGHISLVNVRETASITGGIEFDNSNNSESLDLCRPCKMGKAVQTVSQDLQNRPTGPLTEIYVDAIKAITPAGCWKCERAVERNALTLMTQNSVGL